MTSSSLAYFSNDAIYACLAIFALAFFSHAVEVSWSVKNTSESDKTEFDFSRTDRAGRLAQCAAADADTYIYIIHMRMFSHEA